MKLLRFLKITIENLTGTRIYRKEYLKDAHILHQLPRGINVFSDIETWLPNYRINEIFDVGANIGQSAKKFYDLFPHCSIFCFEPILETFCQLKLNCHEIKQIRCFQLALSSSEGKGVMISDGTSTMNRFLDESTVCSNNIEAQTEQVETVTLDHFCRSMHVKHINYLKIDTEGRDLDVLKGARDMLSNQRIDFIQVEAGTNPNNKYHVPFEILKSFLERHAYYLFGIYNQREEFFTQEPHLRRTNPVFISTALIKTCSSLVI